MKPHAFVAMPFGTKPGHDGVAIDFNRVFAELLKPALEDAGCEVFRADEEQRAGDIRTDMFQELLVADLVVADLTLDNPNVWYELGVRHALRARGVVLVQGPRPTSPFDIYTDRKRRYALSNGGPDPATLAADRAAIATLARETLQASTRRKVSPVYSLLPHLQQPEWQQLLLDERNEFGEAHAAWKSRMEVARQKNRPGDILVLADETPIRALWRQARLDAGNALLKLQQPAFALEQFDAALAEAPDDAAAAAKRVVCLGRVGKLEEAEEAARRLTERLPTDPEAWSLAGRVAKERWIARWRGEGASSAQMREAAAFETAALDDAIRPYHQAFIADPRHFYSGINSLTLHMLLAHLGGEADQAVLDNLAGGVAWASLAAAKLAPKDYWARSSFAELALLRNGIDSVQREWRHAVAAATGDWFALDSSRQTLALLRDLEFRPAETAAALAIVEREIARTAPPFRPAKVLLGAGHMVDAPDRPVPRFPSAMVPQATAAIEALLDTIGIATGDLALTLGAAGGDLIFAEGCARRGARVQMMLPQPEAAFIETSIMRSDRGTEWRERFFALKAQLKDPPRIMTDELGPPPKGVNLYERCNTWLLYTALAWGVERLRFVTLWDGGGGDGPGGTRHMTEEVLRRTGRVYRIDTRDLG